MRCHKAHTHANSFVMPTLLASTQPQKLRWPEAALAGPPASACALFVGVFRDVCVRVVACMRTAVPGAGSAMGRNQRAPCAVPLARRLCKHFAVSVCAFVARDVERARRRAGTHSTTVPFVCGLNVVCACCVRGRARGVAA